MYAVRVAARREHNSSARLHIRARNNQKNDRRSIRGACKSIAIEINMVEPRICLSHIFWIEIHIVKCPV